MSIATQREFRADVGGHKRLMAIPGETAPASDAVAPSPAAPAAAAQDYTPTLNHDYLQASVPPTAAGADFTHTIGEVKRAGKITSVSYVPDAAITGAATNNRTISVVNKGSDGTGTTVVATLAFGAGSNAPISDEKALTLSSTASDLKVNAGDILAFVSTHVGTGIADPGGLVQTEVVPNDT